MNVRELVKYPSMRVALGAFALALVLTMWALVRAIRIDPVPNMPPPTLASAGSIGSAATRPTADIEDAVDSDPFSPDREAPAARYRLPGEPDPRVNEPVVEPERPTLLGTAVSANGVSFAVLQFGDARTESVRVGEKIGVFTLKAIERARVVLVSPTGKRYDVFAIKPEP